MKDLGTGKVGAGLKPVPAGVRDILVAGENSLSEGLAISPGILLIF
jgi:hypothetical protein